MKGEYRLLPETIQEAEWPPAWPVCAEEPAGLSQLELLAVLILGSVFPEHLPTSLPSLTWSITDYLLLGRDVPADITLTTLSVVQTVQFLQLFLRWLV